MLEGRRLSCGSVARRPREITTGDTSNMRHVKKSCTTNATCIQHCSAFSLFFVSLFHFSWIYVNLWAQILAGCHQHHFCAPGPPDAPSAGEWCTPCTDVHRPSLGALSHLASLLLQTSSALPRRDAGAEGRHGETLKAWVAQQKTSWIGHWRQDHLAVLISFIICIYIYIIYNILYV